MVAMPAGAPVAGSTPAARVALVTPEMPPIVTVPVGGGDGNGHWVTGELTILPLESWETFALFSRTIVRTSAWAEGSWLELLAMLVPSSMIGVSLVMVKLMAEPVDLA